MMSRSHSDTYRIVNLLELDDLVIWAKQDCTTACQASLTLLQQLRELLQSAGATRCFVGPIEHQCEFDADGTLPVSSPIIFHLQLTADTDRKAFLYLTDTTTEFHIPERFFVTGILSEDKLRHELIRNLTNDIGQLLQLQWQLAEYDGTTITVINYDDFWEAYHDQISDRVEYENPDE
jgi:hypothetical protein